MMSLKVVYLLSYITSGTDLVQGPPLYMYILHKYYYDI